MLTQRVRLAAYIKLRVPGDFLPFYERLGDNVGGALRGALFAVMIDQTLKAVAILVMNLVFGVPLAVALALVTFLIGFFPLLGEWAVYIPVSIFLLVFQHRPAAAAAYLLIGVAMTTGSSLILRPKLAARSAERFNFYWMLVGLVAGVYAFGIPGIVLGPAILGFAKAIMDTLVGDVKYETSLLKEERAQAKEEAKAEAVEHLTGGALKSRNELTGMDRIGRIRLDQLSLLQAVHPCSIRIPHIPTETMSAGRPRQAAAAEEVDVEVEDGLARVGAGVDDGAVAALGEALFARDARGDEEEVAEQRFVRLARFARGGYVRARDDERVRGRLRVYVAEDDRRARPRKSSPRESRPRRSCRRCSLSLAI